VGVHRCVGLPVGLRQRRALQEAGVRDVVDHGFAVDVHAEPAQMQRVPCRAHVVPDLEPDAAGDLLLAQRSRGAGSESGVLGRRAGEPVAQDPRAVLPGDREAGRPQGRWG
jgi:hypothetical protein